jgi:hypothetical protein
MCFTRAELEAHCDAIIKDPAIRNRVIVLCEGDTTPFKPTDDDHAASIKKQCEATQDSAFYYQAIPNWWRTTGGRLEPNFYICGNQRNVLDAYHYLIDKHQNNQPTYSFLKADRLFALIDIDLANKKIPKSDYPFKRLWDIYNDLYQQGKVNNSSQNHRIWVTGLLHKEAYFLIPELQNLLNQHHSINLPDIYQIMLRDMGRHQDLHENFTQAKNRINHHPLGNCPSIEAFQLNWQATFADPQTTASDKEALAHILLTLAKAKPLWSGIKSPKGVEESPQTATNKDYRNQLCLKIAKDFYAKQSRDSDHHLPQFFHRLAQTP